MKESHSLNCFVTMDHLLKNVILCFGILDYGPDTSD